MSDLTDPAPFEAAHLRDDNRRLREVRAAVLAYEHITDTEYALGPRAGEERAYTPEFLRLLRALYATMPTADVSRSDTVSTPTQQSCLEGAKLPKEGSHGY